MLFHFCSFVCSGYEWVGWESFLIGIRRITQWILSFGFMASILYLRFLLFYPTIGGTILFLLPISVFGSSSLWLWYFSRVPLPAVCVLAEVDFLSEFSSVPFSFFFSFVIFSLACWILQMLFLSFYVLRYFVVFRIALCICLPNLRGGTIFSPFFFLAIAFSFELSFPSPLNRSLYAFLSICSTYVSPERTPWWFFPRSIVSFLSFFLAPGVRATT